MKQSIPILAVAIISLLNLTTWQMWLLIVALVVLLGALIAVGFKIRLNSIHEQYLLMETQVSERTSE